jgi:hypothetical protein
MMKQVVQFNDPSLIDYLNFFILFYVSQHIRVKYPCLIMIFELMSMTVLTVNVEMHTYFRNKVSFQINHVPYRVSNVTIFFCRAVFP